MILRMRSSFRRKIVSHSLREAIWGVSKAQRLVSRGTGAKVAWLKLLDRISSPIIQTRWIKSF